MVDDDGVRRQEEVGETLRDLRELQARAVENLRRKTTQMHFIDSADTRRTTDGLLDVSDVDSEGVTSSVVPVGSTCHS